jgi:hypothetical protein
MESAKLRHLATFYDFDVMIDEINPRDPGTVLNHPFLSFRNLQFKVPGSGQAIREITRRALNKVIGENSKGACQSAKKHAVPLGRVVFGSEALIAPRSRWQNDRPSPRREASGIIRNSFPQAPWV